MSSNGIKTGAYEAPNRGSTPCVAAPQTEHVPEWSIGADCKSVAALLPRRFESCHALRKILYVGIAQWQCVPTSRREECRLPAYRRARIPTARSKNDFPVSFRPGSSRAELPPVKGRVIGSNPIWAANILAWHNWYCIPTPRREDYWFPAYRRAGIPAARSYSDVAQLVSALV